jgi:hopanoid biosynthesis associated protein HpnK
LIFNADDFGWTDGQNLAVERAHRLGVLNRASLLCNGSAFYEAVQISRNNPFLGVGVHLTLNEGLPLLPANHLPHITTPEGAFFDSIFSILGRWIDRKNLQEEVREEWTAQIEKALRTGIKISHLDSHKHVHLLPTLLDVAVDLSQEFQIRYLRLPLEPLSGGLLRRGLPGIAFWLLARRARGILTHAGLVFADHFVGVGYSGGMTVERMLNRLREASKGTVEVMVHPAILTPEIKVIQQRYRWARHYNFEQELQALIGLQEKLTLDLSTA